MVAVLIPASRARGAAPWRGRLGAVLVSLAAAGAMAPAAQGATVQQVVIDHCGYPGERCDTSAPAWELRFTAGPRERNRLRISRTGDTVILGDAGATLAVDEAQASPEELGACVRRSEHEVACDVSGTRIPDAKLVSLRTVLSDGDDRISVSRNVFAGAESLKTYTRLDGGAGDDLLRGTSEYDVIAGGPGADVLLGAGGDDRLSGGAGRDRVSGGGGRNTLAGGSGRDVLDAVNGRADSVSCGAGSDRARVDRADRPRGCERTRRVRRSR